MFLAAQHIDVMRQPCSEEQPCGEWVKAERSRFRPLRNEYNIARTCFRQMQQETDPDLRQPLEEKCHAGWENLSKQLIGLLQTETHDLELFTWLCESQFFAPFPCWPRIVLAFDLLSGWIDEFWWNLHPGLPERAEAESRETDCSGETNDISQEYPVEKLRQRLAPLQVLAGESAEFGLLVMPMRLAPLLPGLTLADFLAAEQQGKLPALYEKWRSQLSSQKDALHQTVTALWDLDERLEKVDKQLTVKAKALWRANSFNLLRRAISKTLSYMESLSRPAGCWPEKAEPDLTDTADESKVMSTVVDGVDQTDSVVREVQENVDVSLAAHLNSEGINSREQAYIHLKQLADYFRHAEPHSPVTLLLDRALYWGRLPLPLLMQELLGDHHNALSRVCDLTGMKLDQHLELMPEPGVSSAIKIQPARKPSVIPDSMADQKEKRNSASKQSLPAFESEADQLYKSRPPVVEQADGSDKSPPTKTATDGDDGIAQKSSQQSSQQQSSQQLSSQQLI